VKPASVPRPKEAVLFRELADGCVLYDPETEKVHSLNLTAGFIWCLIDGARSLEDVADEIASATGADRAVVLRDVLDAAGEFARQGLIS